MQPHGSDRIRRIDGERIVLAAPRSKGWTPRAEKTLTSAQFPGTAVLWDERYYEVVDARAGGAGGVEYVLEPWLDAHVMRVVEQYDDASEAARLAEYREHLARKSGRKAANALALLTGHLPAVVQNAIGDRLGVLPARITLVSLLGELAVLGGVVLWIVSYLMRQEPAPLPLMAAGAFLLVESSARMFVNWTQSRPIGSTLGLVSYIAWWLLTGRRATSPFAIEKGFDVVITAAPAERKAQDELMMREPLLTLLPEHEQRRVAERFGYDYRRHSAIIAAGILVFSLIGIASSLVRNASIAFLVACALAGEQIYRLAVMRRRPVGSVFGFLVRPFVRKFL